MIRQWGNLEEILIFYIYLQNKKGRSLNKTKKVLGFFCISKYMMPTEVSWSLSPLYTSWWIKGLKRVFAARWTDISSSRLLSILFQGALQIGTYIIKFLICFELCDVKEEKSAKKHCVNLRSAAIMFSGWAVRSWHFLLPCGLSPLVVCLVKAKLSLLIRQEYMNLARQNEDKKLHWNLECRL